MPDIAVIILTYNEEVHLERCIKNIASIAKQIFVVDSYSTDKTQNIAQENGASFYQNVFVNQAVQFNWALENLPISTEWVLRIDADEYLSESLIAEILRKLPKLSNDINGVSLPREHIFLGKTMRGVTPQLLRLFRYGKAVCENRWMDEHIVLREGKQMDFNELFFDHNLNTLHWWTEKHNNYSIREAIELLDLEVNLLNSKENSELQGEAAAKRKKKESYANKPLFLRSFLYFIYRYFFKFGFLDGKEGFLWCFLQGWWYRTLVDAKIFEIKKACGKDVDKIKLFIKENYKIEL